MIDSKLGHAGFRIGFYVVLVSGILSLVTERNTAEHVISLFTMLLALFFLGVIVVLVRAGRRM